jgi:hypothetical protein
MTDTSLDEFGPVDYVVVECAADASNFTAEMTARLLALVDRRSIRVIDALVLMENVTRSRASSEDCGRGRRRHPRPAPPHLTSSRRQRCSRRTHALRRRVAW